MIKNKQLFGNFIWNTIGSILASFNSVFFLMAVTRINGLNDAGIFSITVTTACILYVFAIYSGRNGHITDVKNEIKDKDYIVSRILTCVNMLVITIVYIILTKYDIYQSNILFALCLWKSLEAFADVLYAILQKNEKLDIVGQSLVFKSILGIFLFVLVDILTKNLVYACYVLPIVSISVFFLFDLPKTKKFIQKEEKVSKTNVMKIYKNEFFLFASTFLIMYLLNAPKYAIEKYLTNEIQGIYGMILMPASILPLFAQFITAPIIKELTNCYKEKEYKKMYKIQQKLIFLIFGFGLLSMILAYFIGIPVLNLIYRVNLADYKLPLVLIIFAYIIYSVGWIKTILLTIYRKMKEQFIVYLISCIFIWGISDILVNKYGEKGIIPAYVITMSIYYLIFFVVTKYQHNKKIEGEKRNEQ